MLLCFRTFGMFQEIKVIVVTISGCQSILIFNVKLCYIFINFDRALILKKNFKRFILIQSNNYNSIIKFTS